MRPRVRRARDTFELAGWLFADLLLALALLFTAVGGLGPVPAFGDEGPAEVVPLPSASVRVHREAFCAGFRVDITKIEQGDPVETARVRTRLEAVFRPLLEQRAQAAFVQTFATARSIGRGVALAALVNRQLRGSEADPTLAPVFESAGDVRDFGYEHPDARLEGNVWFEVFLLSTGPSQATPCPDPSQPFP